MPKYFFLLNELTDERGRELDGLAEARVAARRLLADKFAAASLEASDCKSWTCIIQDEHRTDLQRLMLAALVDDLREDRTGYSIYRPV